MSDQEAGHETIPDFYKIEEVIHFCPDEHTLRNVINGEEVTLLSTAAECFRILIIEQGTIVSRKEMKEQVWGKRGVIVSSNTFYQNILNLRRGLEKVGAGSHIISTHYGKGVSIDSGIKITPAYGNVTISCPAVNESNETEEENTTHSPSSPGRKNSSVKITRSSLWLSVANFTLFLLCIAMLFMSESLKRENYFSEYAKTPYRVKNCSVFTDPTQMDNNELKQFLSHNTPECEEGETLYLSSVYPIQRMSVIRCTGSFSVGDECESDYYLE